MENDWTIVPKHSKGRTKGEFWEQLPCVAVNKTTLTLNRVLADGVVTEERPSMLVMVSNSRKMLGLKPTTFDENPDAFAVSKKVGSQGRSIANRSIAQRFPECLGHIYKAHMSPQTNVIEVLLTPDNQLD